MACSGWLSAHALAAVEGWAAARWRQHAPDTEVRGAISRPATPFAGDGSRPSPPSCAGAIIESQGAIVADHVPQEVIEEVRRRNDIVDVISEYLPLKGSGGNYKALCPFHSEKTPSFTVTRQKQIFHCFGCGVGGNVFHFIMKYEHMSFPEAVAYLAKRGGVTLPKSRSPATASPIDAQKEQLYRLNELAAEYFHKLLRSTPQGEK